MKKLVWLTLAACMPSGDATRSTMPVPSVDEPFAGLPALSGTGRMVALPTFTPSDHGQIRTITFIGVGELDSTGQTVEIEKTPDEAKINNLATVMRTEHYASLPWTLTPDNPPLPMMISLGEGTDLEFSGDLEGTVTLAVTSNKQPVGRDAYQPETPAKVAPERIVAVGATVIWNADHGYAYVRYDVSDGPGRASEWRVVPLDKTKGDAPASRPVAPAATPTVPAPAPPPAAPPTRPPASAPAPGATPPAPVAPPPAAPPPVPAPSAPAHSMR